MPIMWWFARLSKVSAWFCLKQGGVLLVFSGLLYESCKLKGIVRLTASLSFQERPQTGSQQAYSL